MPAPEAHISESPPTLVERPLMFQGWDHLTFLHWRYRPETICSLLPTGLQLDTCDGAAWIGLTPFYVKGLRPPSLPSFPWVSRFPEMNVRTYVRGPDGERGIWFFSLEADRLAAVVAARASYGLPYRWARMGVRQNSQRVEYTSCRHVGPGQARIVVATGSPICANELERFLTARYRLYTRLVGRLAYAQVEHPPWPLHAASLLQLDQNVIEHSGLPVAVGEPLVHFSPGVYVRIGPPKLL